LREESFHFVFSIFFKSLLLKGLGSIKYFSNYFWYAVNENELSPHWGYEKGSIASSEAKQRSSEAKQRSSEAKQRIDVNRYQQRV